MTPVGIVVALLPEAACLTARPRIGDILAPDPGLRLLVSGIGPARAEQAAQRLADAGVCGLMSIGTAGALRTGLAAGDLLVPEHIVTGTGRLPVDGRWRDRITAALSAAGLAPGNGAMAESTGVLAAAREKSAFGTRHGAVAVDMESAAVLRVAAQRSLPAAVVRVILDAVDLELPALLLRRSDGYGRAHMPGIALDLLRGPAQLPAVWRAAHAFRQAAAMLRRVGILLPALHPGHDAPAAPR